MLYHPLQDYNKLTIGGSIRSLAIGLTRGKIHMFKHLLLAASAVFLAAPAMAQAVPADVELEGTIDSFSTGTRILSVMGMQVFVPATAVLESPAATRTDLGLTADQWFRGVALPGRTRMGFLGGTAIVTGEWDPATNRVVASHIFTEPSENVALGVITASRCTTANCDGPTDYIRGNSKVGGAPGPAMLPLRDIRMAASDVGDEGGFALSLANIDITGLGYVAEGYYGTSAVATNSPSGPVVEPAFHYFLFNLTAPAPQLLLNKTIREVAIERAQCRVAKDFEVRGSVHSRVNPDGTVNDTIRPNNGVIEVSYTLNGQLVRNSAAAVAAAANSPLGTYRVRFNVAGACPDSINVRWLPAANALSTSAYASQLGYGVDVRLD